MLELKCLTKSKDFKATSNYINTLICQGTSDHGINYLHSSNWEEKILTT